MAAAGMLKLSFLLLGLIATATNLVAAKVLPNCDRIECPGFTVVEYGDGYEIRQYKPTVLITTDPIQDISYVNASNTGFLSLFSYIQGKNNLNERVEMTAPVVVDVLRGAGKPSFTTSFFVPERLWPNPPTADGFFVQRRGPTYVAVREFGGFLENNDIGKEVAKLQDSLAGTKWASPVAQAGQGTYKYTTAQYNSPFENSNRVNEIWFLFQL